MGVSGEIEVRTGNGRIVIEGISAAVNAETGDGRVDVSDLHGQVKLTTQDGSIRARGVSGDFDVRSNDGRIELEGRFGVLRAETSDGSIRIICDEQTSLSANWSIRTLEGSIGFSVPTELSAKLEASAGEGRVSNHLTSFAGEERENRLRGILGDGGPLILITTMDGRVTLDEH